MTEPEDETAETGGGDEGGLESSRGEQVWKKKKGERSHPYVYSGGE